MVANGDVDVFCEAVRAMASELGMMRWMGGTGVDRFVVQGANGMDVENNDAVRLEARKDGAAGKLAWLRT